MAAAPLSARISTSSPSTSGALSDPSKNVEAKDSAQKAPQPISPKTNYTEHAKASRIIDETGTVVDGNKRMALGKSDQEAIKEFWKKPRPFSGEGLSFEWTLDSLLTFFVPLFVKTYKGTSIQLIQGVFPIVGKQFWEKFFPDNSFLTAEMWNFCTQTPPCIEFWIELPKSDPSLCEKEVLKKFQDLVIYFVASQAAPGSPSNFAHALHEFNSVIKEEASTEETPRLKEVKKTFKALQSTARTSLIIEEGFFRSVVEIPLSGQTTLKMTFANIPPQPACYQLDHFRLEIDIDSVQLLCPSNAREAFHDHFIHRLVLMQPQVDVRALELYWAHLVLEGPVFNSEQLERLLIKAINPQAWEDGKKHLPAGEDAFLAYSLTVAAFMERHHLLPKEFKLTDLKLASPQTPFAKWILQTRANMPMLSTILALIADLQAGDFSPITDAPRCRKTEICWRASALLYMPFPGDYEKIIGQKIEYSEEFLACFSQALEVFFPSLDQVPSRAISNGRLMEVYQALRNNPKFADAAARFLVVMHKPIDETDVLDLPGWIAAVGENSALLVGKLEKAFQGNRFYPLFSMMKAKALGDSTGFATAQPLLNCGNLPLLTPAWSRYRQVATAPFLLETSFDPTSLPFALNRVYELCHSEQSLLTTEEKVRLLGSYIDRLKQQGGPVADSYTPQLIELLDPLLKADPTLENHLSASTRQTMKDIKTAEEKAHLDKLKESTLLTSDPGAWWDRLLAFDQIVEERGTWTTHREEFDACFIEGLKNSQARLHTRRGFKKIFDRVARKLVDRGEYLSLVSSLRLIPVTRADQIVRPWICECLTRSMESKAPSTSLVPIVTALRETGAYEYVERPFLIRLLHHMTMRFDEITEIPFLISRVNPTQAEVPHLLKFLLDYYTHCYLISYDATKINSAVLGIALDDMSQHLSFFIAGKNGDIVHKVSHLMSVLQKVPQDAELWSKFVVLLDHLKKEDLFLEGSIALLESLTSEEFLTTVSPDDPPFACFTRPFPRMKRRLSAPQQTRLANVYGAVLCRTSASKRENEIIASLPSLDWLMDKLRKEKAWQLFARLFLHRQSRPIADLKNPTVTENAFWVTSRILDAPASPLCTTVVPLIVRLPRENFKPSWKPLIAGWIARESSNPLVKNLYEILLHLADENERRFFERCRDHPNPGSMRDLQEYQKTQTIPKDETPPSDPYAKLREQLVQDLSKKTLSAQGLIVIWTSLGKLPSVEHDLWEKFFGLLAAPHIPIGLIKMIWKDWISKNPAKDAAPSHGKCWHMALQNCLGYSQEMDDILGDFLIKDALALLLQLEGEECKRVTTLCLQLGVITCWRSPPHSCYHESNALMIITQDESLNERLGNPWRLLSKDLEFRLALLLARHASPLQHDVGHRNFILNTTLIELERSFASDTNRELLRCFAARPYTPRDPVSYQAVYNWLENSWLALKTALDWTQACAVVKTLCMFSREKEKQSEESRGVESVYGKWEELATGAWSGNSLPEDLKQALSASGISNVKKVVPPEHLPPFLETTYALMDRIAKEESCDPEKKLVFFLSIYRHVISTEVVDVNPHRSSYIDFKLRWGVQCFDFVKSTTPNVEGVVKFVLNDLIESLPSFNGNFKTEYQKAVTNFTTALKNIMFVGTAHPPIFPLVRKVIEQMTCISGIMCAQPEEKYSWPYLLYCLCEAIPTTTPDRPLSGAAIALQIFTQCIHVPIVEKRASAVPHARLIGISLTQFTTHFLTLEEVEKLLSTKDWENFFQGLLDDQVSSMVASLLEDLQAPESNLRFSLALARTVLYSNTTDPRIFDLNIIGQCLPTFSTENPIPLQLMIRAKWILAIGAYQRRPHSVDVLFLQLQKRLLVITLTKAFLTSVQTEEDYKNYSFYLFQVLKEPEVAAIMHPNFLFPETHPLAARLKSLKSLIELNLPK